MADIEIRNLAKTYPGQGERATDDVSLEVADGEFVVLVGPSGCGKTTLLRMIAGLELPDTGTVSIGGRDVTYLPARQRNLSMVFQSYAVFPHRKVRQNIAFGLAMRNLPKDEIARKVDWAAELLQLGPYLDRYPAQLSGGQRQRVAVARAIVVDADVLLMDEPLSNLDALLRLSFRSELKKIVAEIGTTTVYVTHDQVEALSLGDRIAVMRKGRIVQQGGPIEVYDKPADTFVGGFIGSPPMNFLNGTVAASDGAVRFSVGDQSLPAPAALASYDGRPATLGIRAESIETSQDGGDGAVPVTVDVVEPLGSALLLTVDLAGQSLKVQTPATFQVQAGDTVHLRFPEPALRFYDAETTLGLDTAA
jgi:multiple sugar transport system ATP-binding protein